MSQTNEMKNYTILSNDEIALIYKNAYLKFKEEATTFFNNNTKNHVSPLPKETLIEQMTKVLVLCHKYNIKTQSYLAQMLSANSKEEVSKVVNEIKKEAIETRLKLQPLEQYGSLRRKLYGIEFPEIFQDEYRIYLRTNPILSETELMHDIVDYLNYPLPKNERFSFLSEITQSKKSQEVKKFWLVQNQPMKPVSKLLAWEKDCTLFFNILKNDNKLLSDFYRFITKIPNDKNLGTYFYRFKKKKCFPALHLDTVFLRHIISYHPQKKEIILFTLETIINKLKSFRTQLHEIRIKPLNNAIEDESIDMIMLSIRPNDISTMSAFTNWESCMSVGGSYYQDIMMQIGAGTIIAYGVNSKNPQKRLARALLKPYESAKTLKQRDVYFENLDVNFNLPAIQLNPLIMPDYQEILQERENFIHEYTSHLDEQDFILDPQNVERIYKIDKVYGLQNPTFVRVLETFISDNLNTKNLQGKVMVSSPLYLDQLEHSYQLYDKKDKDNLITYLTNNSLPYQFETNNIVKTETLDISGIQNIHLRPLETTSLTLDGETLNEPIQHLQTKSLTISAPETFKLKVFPNTLIAHDRIIFQNSQKDFDMPLGIKTREINATNTHLTSVAPDLKANTLNITNTKITSLPTLRVQNLILHGCKLLKTLPSDIFVKTKLDVSFSGITHLPALSTYFITAIGAPFLKRLDKNIQFTHLHAQKSALESIPANLKAHTLIANDTFITKVPKGTQIEEVELKNTPLVEISTPINIKKLTITKTPIGSLPKGLSFEKLDASVCTNLRYLPSDISVSDQLILTGSAIQELPPIKTNILYLINCKNIHSLPEGISISKLWAQHSGIETLSKNTKIDVIFLEHSALKELPQGLTASICNVSNTSLTKINENICIDTFICSHTPISKIPASLKTETFEAIHCPNLTEIPPHFSSRKKINITGAPIATLRCIETENLNINHCKNLKHIDSSVKFKNLDASNSGIETLPDFLTVNRINLIDCNIKTLPEYLTANFIDAPRTQINEIPSTIQAGYLNLDSTNITVVPRNINVQILSLRKTPVLTIHYSEHFKEIIVDSNVKFIHPLIPNKCIRGLSNNEINKAKSRYNKEYKKIKFIDTLVENKTDSNIKN